MEIHELNFDLSEDTLTAFMSSVTTAEFALFADTNDDDPATMLGNMALIAAHRLGHSKITRKDIAEMPISSLVPLIEKAAKAPRPKGARLAALLDEISK
ncbi:hypothetical protein [Trueperella pyogenes]|uniref:hypothetical protein n=1 Tax=Trueperella pyogenes TaxID=1661 RepID=UPI00345DF2B3